MASFVTRTFTIQVNNVVPTLSNLTTSTTTINEAGSVNFNINFSDKGFDNSLNTADPSNGGETQESFTYDINWGDGRQELLNVATPDVNGSPGVLSTGSFNGQHIYGDDGTYTVTLTIHDDDGGSSTQTFQVIVNNVAPVLPPFQGTDITTQGTTHIQVTYSDVGFDNTNNANPAAPPTITDRHHESFTHLINWGDGSIDAIHTYAEPGVYTVFVTPPGSLTPLEFTLTVTDINLPPVLTLVGSQAGLNIPGPAQAYEYTINWGDDNGGDNDAIQTVTLMLKGPIGDPFISSQTTVLASARTPGTEGVPTTGSFDVQHTYTGPPNPLNPSADIAITVTVVDDNLGASATQQIAVGNPGINVVNVAIDTTPDVPRLEFVQPQVIQTVLDRTTTTPQGVQDRNVRLVTSELAVTSDQYLELHVISPSGETIARYRLKDEALADLRGLISTLPDNHYKIYLVRQNSENKRLVLDVYVRRGHVVDPSDESEGTRDRPPTDNSQQQNQVKPLEKNKQLERVEEKKTPAAMNVPDEEATQASIDANQPTTDGQSPQQESMTNSHRLRWALPLAGLGLVAARGSWSAEIDAAFDRADDRAWQRLRRAGRVGKLK